MDNAAKVVLHRAPALAELLDSLGGSKDALSTVAELLDELPVGVALIGAEDPSLPLLYLNSQARRIVWSGAEDSEDLVGRPLGEVVAEADGVAQAVREAHEQSGRCRLRYHPQAGPTCDFEAVSLRRGRKTAARVLATWREIQQPSSAGQAPGQPARRPEEDGSDRVDANRPRAPLDAVMEVGGSLEPASVMERMLRRAADEAGADLVVLLRREDDDLVPEAGFDRRPAGDEPGERISLAADSASRRALELGEPVMQSPEPLATDPHAGPRLRDLRHSARVPLPVGGELSGLLLIGRRHGAPFTRNDAALLELLARQAAIAIGNARLYDRAKKTARRLQAGVDVALEVAARLEPEAVVERILHRALDAVDAERAMLGRMGAAVQCTILGCVDRMDEPAPVGLTVSLDGQEPALQAISSRRPAQGRIAYEEIGIRPLRWSLVIPLVVGGELIALLAVGRDNRPFDDEEAAVLQQIGAIAALAYRNATLFQSLRDATRVRSQFLNMAAHELRTPLSVIAGYVSMLEDGTLGAVPAAWQTPLVVLVDKTRELAHLIDDILLAGRLESGVARTSGHSMDISESLEEAVRRAGPRAALLAADVKLRTRDSAVRVWADPDHVGRILDNLVNNAFSYSPAPPRVSLTLATDAGSAVVRVEDGGRGIAPDHRDRIFQQFYRVEEQAVGYPPGTGLGLFISRALAERYGGSLDLEWSEPGVGSRFALRLPLASEA
ncbi:MAG: GAF domain-containing protein [Candidatus Dormibacteraeota bacterium]|nr:GAF domain-containing protein [Candidatus Dormibacteraeota bacterium]